MRLDCCVLLRRKDDESTEVGAFVLWFFTGFILYLFDFILLL